MMRQYSRNAVAKRLGREELKEKMGRLQGKVALVTGGSSGIGRATAYALAREDARLVVSGRNQERGEETVERITAAGGEAVFIKAEVSNAAEVEAIVAAVIATYGRLDCAVNAAGVGLFANTVDCPERKWNRVLSVNLKGTWLCMKYEIPQLLKVGGGAIVNVSSITGVTGVANMPAYSASKHGIIGLTKTAALEYAKFGIRINAVCPGSMKTPMQDPVMSGNPEAEAELGATHPIGRMGTAAEAAEAIVWLCSDAASFVMGHAMMVDGEYAAQ